MELYKIYVSTKKKDGTITKADKILSKGASVELAIGRAIREAKIYYGFKGKVHVVSVYVRNAQKAYIKVDLEYLNEQA